MTLRVAEKDTAASGDSTRVDTTVATALAESFQPLVKSNTSAAATTARIIHSASGMPHRHAFEDVGHILASVGGLLEHLVDFLELDDPQGVRRVGKQAGQGMAQFRVGLVFQLVEAHGVVADLAHLLGPQEADGLADLGGRLL